MRRALAALDAWQRRHAGVAFVVAVGRKFGDDGASQLAALIAYYAFFSLFPLLLALVSVLGFVLEDNPSLRDEVLHSALARVPVIGQQLEDEVTPLTGSTPALVIGLVGALWAGLGVMLAISRAFQTVWAVPRIDRRGPVGMRVRGLALLGVFGVLLLGSVVLGGLAVEGLDAPAAERAAAGALSLAGTAALLLALFRLLGPGYVALRDQLPGVAIATAGSVVLQSAGAWYVSSVIAGAAGTYGTFALVIGLLSWFWVGAHVLLAGAETNVVRRERLWPRSLTERPFHDDDPQSPGSDDAWHVRSPDSRISVEKEESMTQDPLEEMGPVDYVVLEWPGRQPKGDVAPMILELADRGIIRILDVALMVKGNDGSVAAIDLGEVNGDGAGFDAFTGASTGLLGQQDLEEAAAALAPGTSAAVLVWENRWAAPVAVAVRKSGGQLVASGRIEIQAILAALDALEENSAVTN